MGYCFRQRPRKRQAPEGHLVLQCLHYLKARGYTAGKIKVQGSPLPGGRGFLFDPYRMTGLPDIFAFKQGGTWYDIMYGIECKNGKNTQTDNQLAFQKLFHFPPSRVYLVIRSLDELVSVVK